LPGLMTTAVDGAGARKSPWRISWCAIFFVIPG